MRERVEGSVLKAWRGDGGATGEFGVVGQPGRGLGIPTGDPPGRGVGARETCALPGVETAAEMERAVNPARMNLPAGRVPSCAWSQYPTISALRTWNSSEIVCWSWVSKPIVSRMRLPMVLTAAMSSLMRVQS